jgi:HemY protein
MSYEVKTSMGVFLAVLAVFILVLMMAYKLILALKRAPDALVLRHERSQRKKSQRALAQGLSAIAAGDVKHAEKFTRRARRLDRDDTAIVPLLEGMTARMKGDDVQAKAAFDDLMKHKDTAFLGVRGLMQLAVDEGRFEDALTLAHKAHKTHPKQRWIIKTLYNLSLQAKDWGAAQDYIRKAQKSGLKTKAEVKSDLIAMELAQSMHYFKAGDMDASFDFAQSAHKRDKTSLPAALAVLPHLLKRKKKRAAIAVVEKAWAHNPHPDLLIAWKAMSPKPRGKNSRLTPAKVMAWYERLLALKPDSAEGQMAVAEIAMDAGMFGEARAYLDMAEKLRPTKKLYKLYAALERKQYQDEEKAAQWLAKALEAPQSKMWICTQSGLIYDMWTPFAAPHNSFNTIIWDYPEKAQNKHASLYHHHVAQDHLAPLIGDMRSVS